MDRGAWWAKVLGITELDMTLHVLNTMLDVSLTLLQSPILGIVTCYADEEMEAYEPNPETRKC